MSQELKMGDPVLMKISKNLGLNLTSKQERIILGRKAKVCTFDILFDKTTHPKFGPSKVKRFLHEIYKYKFQKVLTPSDEMFDQRACSSVALDSEENLSRLGFDVGRISVYPDGNQKTFPLFLHTSKMDFGHHTVNYIKVEDDLFFAFDLTSQYNIFPKSRKDSVLCVVGSSIKDLEQKLRKMYNSAL